ncbi:MAG: DnaA N-terminal domain-containing protein, partial [Chloroflexota bacterium]
MNPQQIWQSVLNQLQSEMPRASFDTWMRDTNALSLEDNLLTISARNAYARDWLDSRLTNRIQRILVELLNQTIAVRFVTEGAEEEDDSEEETPESEIAIEPVQWLDYEKIVQPHRQVVVKGYLRRLAAEIGPKAIWLYIGFHQAAWRAHAEGKESGLALHSREVMRFSGLSEGAFWRLMKEPEIQRRLNGLVQRIDPSGERRYRPGRDGRPHRMPIRYRVCMTPRLRRADSSAVHSRLKVLLVKGASVRDAFQEMLNMDNVIELLDPVELVTLEQPLNTVMDMARAEAGEAYNAETDRLAQELHRRIVNCLG